MQTSANEVEARLRALPVQVIDAEDGVLLRRGASAFKIAGEHAGRVVRLILSAASGGGLTRDEVAAPFPAEARSAIDELTTRRVERRILATADGAGAAPEEPESALDVYYWNFGVRAEQVSNRLDTRRIAILGVNH